MKRLPGLLLLVASVNALAQGVTYEAVPLASALAEASWPSVKNSLPVLTSGLQAQLRAGGGTDSASRLLADELRAAITQENLARAVATMLSEKFSVEELQTLNGFFSSPLGKKYLVVNQEMSTNPRYVRQMIEQACAAANKKLDLSDRASISDVCG